MIKSTSPTEIEDITPSFDTRKKAGLNSLPQEVVKPIKKSIAFPLANNVNNVFLRRSKSKFSSDIICNTILQERL